MLSLVVVKVLLLQVIDHYGEVFFLLFIFFFGRVHSFCLQRFLYKLRFLCGSSTKSVSHKGCQLVEKKMGRV
jgi:hypothetical protein